VQTCQRNSAYLRLFAKKRGGLGGLIMRRLSIAVVAAVSTVAFTQIASAAAPPPAPVYSWTGCYVGGNIGYGWAPTKWSDGSGEFASHTPDAVVGGGQIGCDYQMGQWVIGIQGMFDASGMKGDSHRVVGALGPDIFDQTQISWLATLTGRIGYTVQPATLLYIKGGAAWVRDKYNECCLPPAPPPFSPVVDDGFANVTRTGWTVGVGLEYMLQPNWSAFFEYDYIGLGTDAITFTPTGRVTSPFVYNIQRDVQMILVGLNYRFGGIRGR